MSFTITISPTAAENIMFPPYCCCCSKQIGPTDKDHFQKMTPMSGRKDKTNPMTFVVPVCPDCQIHWRLTRNSLKFMDRGIKVAGFFALVGFFSLGKGGHLLKILLLVALPVFFVAGLTTLISRLMRPKITEPGHVQAHLEPMDIDLDGQEVKFAFQNDHFALDWAKLNSLPDSELKPITKK